MKEIENHISLLRHMSSVLRERKSAPNLSSGQKNQCEKGIDALDKAVEALQTQVYA
jgi:hypothetical protein